mmetsp:Transcript_13564/g.26158  ORF Transcript_13564/g.26158 Transcript_13564/m.26158 type:complete len:142 (+) Transcript_13564:150-575(+)
MRILGLGVDIAHIPRFERTFSKFGDRFARKFLHEHELRALFEAQAEAPGRVTRYLASRWAAKEATYKALGPSQPRLLFPEFEVVTGPRAGGPQPKIQLHGHAAIHAEQIGVEEIFLSLSHDGEYAFAQVLLQGSPKDMFTK